MANGANGTDIAHITLPTASGGTILDTNLTVITPVSLTNFDPQAAPTCIIREGQANGIIPFKPDWFFIRNDAGVVRGTGGERGSELFIAPGATFTVLKVEFDRSFDFSVAIEEL